MRASSIHPGTSDAEHLEDVRAAELRVVLGRIHRALRTRTSEGATFAQASALSRIEQHGPLRLGVLADLEGTSAATMCRLVEGLELRQLITRVTDPEDGRASLVQLSEEGDALLAGLRARNTAVLSAALAKLTAAERHSIERALPALEHLNGYLGQLEP